MLQFANKSRKFKPRFKLINQISMQTRTPQKPTGPKMRQSTFTDRPMFRGDYYNEYFEANPVFEKSHNPFEKNRSATRSVKSSQSLSRPNLSGVSDNIKRKMDKIMNRISNISGLKATYAKKLQAGRSQKSPDNWQRRADNEKPFSYKKERAMESQRETQTHLNFDFQASLENIRNISAGIRSIIQQMQSGTRTDGFSNTPIGRKNMRSLNLKMMTTLKSVDYSHANSQQINYDSHPTEAFDEDILRANGFWPPKKETQTRASQVFSQRNVSPMNRRDIPFNTLDHIVSGQGFSERNVPVAHDTVNVTMSTNRFQPPKRFLNEADDAVLTNFKKQFVGTQPVAQSLQTQNFQEVYYDTGVGEEKDYTQEVPLHALNQTDLIKLKQRIDKQLGTKQETASNISGPGTAHQFKGQSSGLAEDELKQSNDSLAKLAKLIEPKEKFTLKSPLGNNNNSFQQPNECSYEETDASLLDIQKKLKNWDCI